VGNRRRALRAQAAADGRVRARCRREYGREKISAVCACECGDKRRRTIRAIATFSRFERAKNPVQAGRGRAKRLGKRRGERGEGAEMRADHRCMLFVCAAAHNRQPGRGRPDASPPFFERARGSEQARTDQAETGEGGTKEGASAETGIVTLCVCVRRRR
jgi:hypothetical protein